MTALRQIPMISLPMKQTDEVELARPLRHFIAGNYGQAEKYTEEGKTLDRLRQDMSGAGRDEVGRDLLYRYYGQLELLELRFPIDEDHIRIAFNWHDAFTDVAISQYSLAYEKACVLFNIASILSFTAASQVRTETDGMKRAYHCFQACAGLLTFINDNFLHAPSTDLSREMVRALAVVMLAQAQEVFTEQQIRSAGKSTIIAKLAAEAAHMYHLAGEALNEIVVAGNIDRIWLPYVQCKDKYFTCLAQYHQAIVEGGKSQYGLSVARFAVAAAAAKEALALAKSHSGEFARYPHLSAEPGLALVEVAKAMSDEVADKYADAKRENDLIYHEVVAKEAALPAVARLNSAKPISLTDLYAGQDLARIVGPDIFAKLVPLAVHESASLYSDEVDKMLRAEQEKSEIGDTELATALDYLGLPKSLHRFKQSDDRLAQDLQAVSAELQEAQQRIAQQERHIDGGLAGQLKRIQEARAQITRQLAQVEQALHAEQAGWSGMRQSYGERWSQASSDGQNRGFCESVASIRTALQTATASDAKTERAFDGVAEEIATLGNEDPEHLESIFRNLLVNDSQTAASNTSSLLDLAETETHSRDATNAIAIKVDQVDDLVRKLALIKKERHTTLQDLKDKARADDISNVLILNRKTPGIEQRVFAAELDKFRPHRTRIAATLARQNQLVEEMTQVFAQVLEDKSLQQKQKRWQLVTKRKQEREAKLLQAAGNYRDLAQAASEAALFYADLGKLSGGLVQQVEQWCQQRKEEGRSLLAQVRGGGSAADGDLMRQRLAQLSMGGLRPPTQPPYGGGSPGGYGAY